MNKEKRKKEIKKSCEITKNSVSSKRYAYLSDGTREMDTPRKWSLEEIAGWWEDPEYREILIELGYCPSDWQRSFMLKEASIQKKMVHPAI